MGDSWLNSYDVCAQLGQGIMESIMDRNKQPKTSTPFIKKSAALRTQITKYDRDLSKLVEDLSKSSLHHKITPRESDRRQSMLDNLVTKQKQIELAFKNDDRSANRASLLTSANGFSEDWGGGGYNNLNNDADPFDNNMGLDQIRAQHRVIIEEQDRGLEALSRVVGRQKEMAITIGNEVQDQNDLIDDIHDHMDHTNTRLIRETRHIKIVDKKSATCWMWIVIVLLLVAIVVIACVPYTKKK